MILTVCQPILDRKSVVPSNAILQKSLKTNGYTEINDQTASMLDDLTRYTCFRETPGGSSLNTIRAISKIAQIKTAFIGAIGNDENGTILCTKLQNDKTAYKLERLELNTAECKVLINSDKRSMITNIGAANHLLLGFIASDLQLIYDAEIIYLCGFFVASMPENAEYIISKIEKQKFIFNLSHESVLNKIECGFLCKIIAKSNVVMGNLDEMKQLKDILYPKYDSVESMMASEAKNGKIFVSTNAEKEVYYSQNGQCGKVHAKQIRLKSLDTCGAGDYFAAGFISAYYSKIECAKTCAEIGCEWASDFIEKSSLELNMSE